MIVNDRVTNVRVGIGNRREHAAYGECVGRSMNVSRKCSSAS